MNQRVSTDDATGILDATLREYADRGVFRNLQRSGGTRGGVEFHFAWLYDQPFTLTYNAQRKSLALIDLLPNVETDSMMHKELKAFLKRRSDAGLPDHRRVDAARGVVTSRTRSGVVSVEMTVRGDEYQYATRKLIQVVHEVFLFLNEYWAEYMWKSFQLTME